MEILKLHNLLSFFKAQLQRQKHIFYVVLQSSFLVRFILQFLQVSFTIVKVSNNNNFMGCEFVRFLNIAKIHNQARHIALRAGLRSARPCAQRYAQIKTGN
jgi:hypothetical protein